MNGCREGYFSGTDIYQSGCRRGYISGDDWTLMGVALDICPAMVICMWMDVDKGRLKMMGISMWMDVVGVR